MLPYPFEGETYLQALVISLLVQFEPVADEESGGYGGTDHEEDQETDDTLTGEEAFLPEEGV